MNAIELAFICGGLTLLVFGGLWLWGWWLHTKKLEDLRENGDRVIAKLTKIEAHRHFQNGHYVHDYDVIEAEWTDPKTGITRTFTGNTQFASGRHQLGDGVPVLVDRKDLNRYIVDL